MCGRGSLVLVVTPTGKRGLLTDARAVFFDVDDTLYDFEGSMRLAFEHLHRAFPSEFAQTEVDELSAAYWSFYRGMPEPEKVHLINTDPELFRRTMWVGALAKLGLDVHPDSSFARLLTDEFQKERPKQWRAAMYPGARDLLLELKARGTILGAITNGPTLVQRPKLEALSWPDYFTPDRVFVSGEFGARKPDPSIFLAAAKSAGVEPRECVMVGDAVEFDMPAKAVGFRTVLYTAAHRQREIPVSEWKPDAIVSNYDEVRALFF